jgi:peptidoglycan/LPS O-acetylase OafA/YrhL
VGYFDMANTDQRLYGIDLARSIAILGVVLVHCGLFENGRFGVQLFFLVSGFLLADLGKLSGRDFLIRRGFRLFPLYWIILILFYRNDFDSFWQLFISLTLIQSTHWIFTSTPGAWSISNEWIFSLLLPIIRRITRKKIFIIILFSWLGQLLSSFLVWRWGGVTSSEGETQYALYIWVNTLNPFINVSFFLIGIGLKKTFIPILKNRLIAFTIIIASQLSSLFLGLDMLFLWPPILWAIFSLCIGWTPRSKITKYFVRFIGKRTYGIFFIHFIILAYLTEISWIQELSENLRLQQWTLFAITFITSAIFADFCWRFIENPSIKISRRFIRNQ